MNKIIYIAAIAGLLWALGGTGALAMPVPASASGPNPEALLTRLAQRQQDTIEQREAARLQQVLALVRAGQPAEVEFAGTLQRDAQGGWTVAGLQLNQSSATVFEGAPAAGLHAHVRAQIHSDGSLEALHVHTLVRTMAAVASQHMAGWLNDDHGVRLGGCQEAPHGDHAAEHTATAATQQAQHRAHHAEPPAPLSTQPQPSAPPPGHHPEGDQHSSGHHSGHH